MATLRDFWPDILVSAAKWGSRYGVSIAPELVGAVILKENPKLDPRRVTPEPGNRRSIGLMQVLEDTAHDLGYSDARALLVPAVGIDAGTQYLAKQLARYHGDVSSAVAAYNAGSAKFDTQERYVNQSYVDAVRRFYNGLISAVKPDPFVPESAIAGLLLAALFVWNIYKNKR